jgi:hypothetical protein
LAQVAIDAQAQCFSQHLRIFRNTYQLLRWRSP